MEELGLFLKPNRSRKWVQRAREEGKRRTKTPGKRGKRGELTSLRQRKNKSAVSADTAFNAGLRPQAFNAGLSAVEVVCSVCGVDWLLTTASGTKWESRRSSMPLKEMRHRT